MHVTDFFDHPVYNTVCV